jgi:hypothetical protein
MEDDDVVPVNVEFVLGAYMKQDDSGKSQEVLTVVYEFPSGAEKTPTRGELKDRNLLSEIQKRESLRKWETLRLDVIKIVEYVFTVGVPFPALAVCPSRTLERRTKFFYT